MGTVITGSILIAAVLLAARSMIRSKKAGKSLRCGGNCSNCRGCH